MIAGKPLNIQEKNLQEDEMKDNIAPRLVSFIVSTLKEESKNLIILMTGECGVGKTFLTSCLIAEMRKISRNNDESSSLVTSPTFNIVNTYKLDSVDCVSKGSIEISHFDLYRIRNVEELEAIGMPEQISSSDISIIEWSEIATCLQLKNYASVRISINIEFSLQNKNGRNINIMTG